MKHSLFKILGLTAATIALGIPARANSFDLLSSEAVVVSGNTTSTFYNVAADGTDSGTAALLYSSTLGGDADTGFWVKISFDGNPQPVLTSAFLKAADFYLWWDSTALGAFNAGTFDSITLWNSGDDGIFHTTPKGKRQYQGTSHAGLNGTPGTSVPDGGATVALLGLGLLGLAALRRRLIRR